jgi:hypothetical protein
VSTDNRRTEAQLLASDVDDENIRDILFEIGDSEPDFDITSGRIEVYRETSQEHFIASVGDGCYGDDRVLHFASSQKEANYYAGETSGTATVVTLSVP